MTVPVHTVGVIAFTAVDHFNVCVGTGAAWIVLLMKLTWGNEEIGVGNW